jgi:hypothetical protein
VRAINNSNAKLLMLKTLTRCRPTFYRREIILLTVGSGSRDSAVDYVLNFASRDTIVDTKLNPANMHLYELRR